MNILKSQLPRRHLASVPQFARYDLDRRALKDADREREFKAFIRLSVAMTGFTEAELASTGMGKEYFDELGVILGVGSRTRLLSCKVAPAHLMIDPFHGPLVRNLIRMWYLGQWKQLPETWIAALTKPDREAFDDFGLNTDRVISARAYTQGLAWTAIRAHPSGAKQPGFASWSGKP